MGRRAWWVTVHGIAKSLTRLSDFAFFSLDINRASLMAQLVKNLPAMQEALVQFLGREDPLEEG